MRAADNEIERERENEAIELSLRLSRCALVELNSKEKLGAQILPVRYRDIYNLCSTIERKTELKPEISNQRTS